MSVRRRLLIGLIALVVIVDGLAGLLTYRRALQATAQMLDYQLYQMALSLRDQGSAVPDIAAATQGKSEFAIQIWNKDGAPIYASRPEVPLTHEGLDGYGDLAIDRDVWRAFALHTPRRIILVAQARSVRAAWARSIAIKAIGPLLVLMPILAIGIWLLVVRTLQPIKRVAEEFSQRDADSLAPVRAQDLPEEISPLVDEVNRLLGRLAAALTLQRAFIADAAHELRSPLTALSLHLQLLLRARTEAERAESREKVLEAMQRANVLVQQLLTLARNEPGAAGVPHAVLRLDEVVATASGECSTLAQTRSTTLASRVDGPVEVVGDAQALHALARNLIDNAIRYTPAGGLVEVAVARGPREAQLRVDDSGPGVPQAERERLFDRFYRREAAGGTGSGLGLAIVKSIAARHGGTVELGQSHLGGLRATVTLPLAGS
jgi:signal transduction histidine kinase